ncbi:hypothetical protein DLJ53_28100 [Acuticoccus sediminis]|uniref:Sulphur transport domain-containing protein n=1 Tax=Acuticoccus sediminis TaxID=2184697 RepID=A0A8B2NK26_9HYPH|nr:YeeE/YedE family protein [Acuticoccus sediminis]RAH97711.1 hypothetical protein DLJ53_28100 [Acuticoccus sediminis]
MRNATRRDEPRPAGTPPQRQPLVVAVAAAAIAALTIAAARQRPEFGPALLIGAFAGFALVSSAYGFAGSWRRFIVERRGAGIRAQCLMLMLAALFALPIIHGGDLLGIHAGGWVFPFGVAVAVGAFLFGLGMQLGGGCASGTLFTVGGGSVRMVLVLVFFIAGGVIATAHWDFWSALPRLPAIGLATLFGVPGAILLTFAVCGVIAVATVRAEKARHGDLAPSLARWSPRLGALSLALVVAATLVILGRPWGITSGFTLWGAKLAHVAGVPIETWTYWRSGMDRVEAPLLADGTSVMNFGIIAGAMLASGLAGRFAPTFNLSLRDIATAVVGGLLMGYGARIATGCNIGALLSGVASGSLHGWGWFAFAFLGSIAGVRMRGLIGMDAPRPVPA